jgi:hypothetical protein
MYIVIVCVNCNGSSQVEEAMLGKVVECPLCGKPTVARTQTAVLPVARPIESPAPLQTLQPDAPLSLDDATPLPHTNKPKAISVPVLAKPVARPATKRSPVRTAVYATISLLITLLLMIGIYSAFRYGNGQISDSSWEPFQPPDGRCTVLMPGEPQAADIPATSAGELGGKRFVVKRWFERVEIEFGWMDYDAARVEKMGFDQFVMPLRDREIKRLNGKLIGESQVNYTVKDRDFVSRLATIDLEKGKAFLQVYFDADLKRLPHREVIELVKKQPLLFVPLASGLGGCWVPVEFTVEQKRQVIEPGARVRLWFACAHGNKVTSDMKWISKYLTSFAPD